jgi:hypothetical protein
MSDFSELCPLFSTGVFKELLFPRIVMTHFGTANTENALVGTTAAMASAHAFTFGRTVVITNAWMRKRVVPVAAETLVLHHHTSKQAAGTVFGTLNITVSVSGQQVVHGYFPMNVTSTTFNSTDVLGVLFATVTEDDAGEYDIVIRYKEK